MKWIVVLGALMCPVSAFAERVEMKSGEVYVGDIIDRNDQYLTIKSGGAPMYLPAEQIANVSAEKTIAPDAVVAPGQMLKEGSPEYVCKNAPCAFKIPEGFTLAEDKGEEIVLLKGDKSIEIKVVPLKGEKPYDDETIGVLAAQMTASSIKLGAYDMDSVRKAVKIFGERKVSGRKAFWFYYPELHNQYLMHRTFVSTPEGSGFLIEANIYPQPNRQYVEQGDKLANAFLDGFQLRE